MNTPDDVQANQGLSWAFMAVAAVFFVVGLAWAIRERRVGRGNVALLALAGGLIASLEEAWINLLIKLWYPSDAPLVVFTAIGHAQPLYVHLVYPGFVGLGAYVVYRGLVSNPDGRLLWPAFGAICAMDLAFELPATAANVFSYYGPQPFQLFDDAWPIWPAAVNAAGPILGGWLMYRFEPLLPGRAQALLVLMPPLAYAGVYGATGWPTYTMLNSDVPDVFRWLAAILTVALCAAVVWAITVSLQAASASTRLAVNARAPATS